MLLVTERISRRSILQTYGSSDIACVYLLDFLSLIGVHLQNTADSFFLSFYGIIYVGTGFESTGVHSEECQLTDERIGHDLKCQCRKRSVVICRTFRFFFCSRTNALDRRDVQRRRHIIDNGVQHKLYSLVLICRSAEHRDHLTGDRRLSDRFLNILLR